MDRNKRLAVGLAVITLAAIVAVLTTTFFATRRFSYPQRILAREAASFLARGYDPALVVTGDSVDVRNGGTWMTVTDLQGRVLASNATEGGAAVSLASCREQGTEANCFFAPKGEIPQNLSVELPSGSRQSLVFTRFGGENEGFVVAGRQVDPNYARLFETLRMIIATYLAGVGCFLMGNRFVSRRTE